MLRLRVATVVLVAVGACGGSPPVELRTAADVPAVVLLDHPRPGPDRPHPTTTTTVAPPASTTSTTAPPQTVTTSPPAPVVALQQPTPPTPAQSGGCLGWASTIAAHFPPEQRAKACSVMTCETGGTGDPTIHNRSSSASGLWQFLDSTWASVTGLPPPAANYSGDQQTAAAAALWRSSGWGQWSCA